MRRVTNGIFWGNTSPTDPSIYDEMIAKPPQVVHSAVQYGYSGGTMILDADPLFVTLEPSTGQWVSVVYDPATFTTALTVSGMSWGAESLVGLFVQLTATDPRWFAVVSTFGLTIWVHGDVTGIAAASQSFTLRSLRLSSTSLCIDAGYGCSAASCTFGIGIIVPETPLWDIEGKPAYDAGKSVANGGESTPDYLDMGAYEWP